MPVYKDVLELSRVHEIIDEFDNYPVFKSGKLTEDEAGVYLYIEFTKEILAFDTENQEYVQTEAWTIHEWEKFEFYPDDLRLIAEF